MSLHFNGMLNGFRVDAAPSMTMVKIDLLSRTVGKPRGTPARNWLLISEDPQTM